MAKKKKHSPAKKKPVKVSAPKHNLPKGFWSQAGALLLIVISILIIVAWFNAGGPLLDWVYRAMQDFIGYSVYILPALFVYMAVEIFKAEDNRLPFVMKLGAMLSVIWFSGLFGLLKSADGSTTGGSMGDLINQGMLALVNASVASFIYSFLIIITALFVFRVSPIVVIQKIWQLIRRDNSEQEANVKVMRTVAAVDGEKEQVISVKTTVPTWHGGKPEGEIRAKNFEVRTPKIAEESAAALVTVSDPNWQPPSLDLLEKKQSPADEGDVQANAKTIKDTLKQFDIDVQMEGANIGPRITQYTLQPADGVKLTRITALEDNLALALKATSLRIEAPIPGQKAVGIEVPNIKAADVRLYSILSSKQWKAKTEPLSFAVGQDISGNVILGELNDMPHLLIAGQTKAGKSVMINTLLTSLIYHNSPSNLKLILVDPKLVEMTAYEDIPHLLTPIINGTEKTVSALRWAAQEMERRYDLMKAEKVKNIKDYNAKINAGGIKIPVADEDGIMQDHEHGFMPYVVIVIDELNDLMMEAPKDMEALIVRLAQKARAVGIHLVLATQSPRANVITGLIKANIPAKIAFAVSNQLESRIILDQNGAEKLLGHGDMLFLTTNMSKPVRAQGAWVTEPEIHRITDFLRTQSPPQYNDDVVSQPVNLNGKGGVVMDFGSSEHEPMFDDAVQVVINSRKASATLLQTRLRIGYAKAARLIAAMEEQGIIGPADGARPREVLVSSYGDFGSDNDSDDEV